MDKPDLTDYATWFDDKSSSGFSPTTIRPTETYRADGRIRNNGTAPSGDFKVVLVAKKGNVAYLLNTQTVPSLDPFTDVPLISLGRFPFLPEGTYDILWVIDFGDSLEGFQNGGDIDEFVEGGDNEILCGSVDVAAPVANATIRGTVWDDPNGNGNHDAGEGPLSDWRVYLDDNFNMQWDPGEDSALTDADGKYEFSGMEGRDWREGDSPYYVSLVVKDDWIQTGDGFMHEIYLGDYTLTTGVDFLNKQLFTPVVDAGGPYSLAEGHTIVLNGSATDGDDAESSLIYEWDLEGDPSLGVIEWSAFHGANTGKSPTFSAVDFRGPNTFELTLRVEDPGGLIGTDTVSIHIDNGLLFDPVGAGLPALDQASLAWGDYDNDGDLDLLMGGRDAGATPVARVFRNDNGSFTSANAGLPGVNAGSVEWGDYDNDGLLDILLAGSSSAVAEVYHNEGGSFNSIGAGMVAVSLGFAAWGDYDNDGDPDILLTGRDAGANPVAMVYRNDVGTFSEDTNITLVGVESSSAAWGDYDNDGKLDIVLVGNSSTGPIARVYHNEGASFQEAADLSGVYDGSAAWGDYDSDGDLDLLLTGYSAAGPVSQLYRNVAGTFTLLDVGLPGVAKGQAVWGDYDNYGRLDILLTGEGSDGVFLTEIYRFEYSDFVAIGTDLEGLDYSAVAWGDYDGDNDLDIVAAGRTSGFDALTRLYANDVVMANTPPKSPTDLTATAPTATSITLSWEAAYDSRTSKKGLTHNLRVGTTPGGHEIMATGASPQGNVGHNTSWTLEGLTLGQTYYWSVQAIDTAFAASPFASEQASIVVSEVSVTASDPDASEPSDNGQFSVNLRFPVPVDTIVDYTVFGAATPGIDYSALPGSVTIMSGESSATIDVVVLNDGVTESAEIVGVNLSGVNHALATVATSLPHTATVIIKDDDTAWEQDKFTAADAAVLNHFGGAVSISGDVALVGAPGESISRIPGAAYVFRWDGSTWVQEAKLTASDAASEDFFGESVSISGNVALVGASGNDDAGGGSGSAYVFRWDGTSWNEEAKLTASDASGGDYFGLSVSLAGDTALVGAYGNDDAGLGAGCAYVFRWNGSSWTQESKLVASDATANDQFGISVSLSGDTALVGAYFDGDGDSRSGSAYVFRRNGSSWTQESKLVASDAAWGDEFGRPVSIDGDTAMVGAFRNDDAGSFSGSAYIFRRNGSSWAQESKLVASDAAEGGRFGLSVSIDGDAALVGAASSAYVFRWNGTTWASETKFAAFGLGSSVSINGEHALVGAAGDNEAGDRSGSAYFFKHLVSGDADGVIDSVEDGAPNGGDGNNDGIADSVQDNVASLPNAEDAQYVSIESEGGTLLDAVAAIDNPSPADTPPGAEFGVGFFSFRVLGLAPGAATTVTQYLPEGTVVNTYYMFGPTPDDPTPHWYEFLYDGVTGAELIADDDADPDTDRVVLHFVDGMRGDNDLIGDNGVIEDPGATAFKSLLHPITDKNVEELQPLVFDVAALVPLDGLAFRLDDDSVSAGMSIDPATGTFQWTPSEAQGSGTYSVTVTATETGGSSVSDSQSFDITVAKVNAPPILNEIGDKSVNERAVLTFTATASDPDLPADILSFSLDAAAEALGMTITSDGEFSWTPNEAQGGISHESTITVSDGSLSNSETITVTVTEINVAPILDEIGDKSVDEGVELTFTATANDLDLPVATLTFRLDASAEALGMTITSDGEFSWTPNEAQGGISHEATITVSDGSLSNSETITVTVTEINVAPILDEIGDKWVNEGDELTFIVTANDPDLPANTLTFSLDAAAEALGMAITGDGEFSWMPTGAQGPSIHQIIVRVTDDGTPSLDDSRIFTITVSNVAPSADANGPYMINEGGVLQLDASASTDPGGDPLTYAWDIDCDGLFDDALGVRPTVPWRELVGLAGGSVTIALQVTDSSGATDTDTATLTVGRPSTIDDFRLFTDETLTLPGLTGSYVDQSLRSYQPQDDWRISQPIAGTRVDPSMGFVSLGWGTRASVGLTGGSDYNWDNFSVQWDGYVQILTGGTRLTTRSDDGSRMWVDVDHDGLFDSSSLEFVDNHWGSGQATTLGPVSVPLEAGVYRIRIQYEEQSGGNVMELLTGPPYLVRSAYIVPSNRQPQEDAIANLRWGMLQYQAWYTDQMERYGFGPKTFQFETEADGVTPRIHVIDVPEIDTYFHEDTWNRVLQSATDVGVPLWSLGQVWILAHEAYVMNPDGSLDGGVALDLGGTGSSGGVSLMASNPFTSEAYLLDDREYDGLTIPELGPYPMQRDLTFAWFEGSTVSTVSSSYFGARLHEMSHGFGLVHNMHNDSNFNGNLMGNGLRGFRGWAFPDNYPDDDLRLSYANALALNVNRYFNSGQVFTEDTGPGLSILTSGDIDPVNGQIEVRFTASDSSGLSAAYLANDSGPIAEMSLLGTSVDLTFRTPRYTPGEDNLYWIRVFDTQGNSRDASTTVRPSLGSNRAPIPFLYIANSQVIVGQQVELDASRSDDPDHPLSALLVEWDLDGDGVFDTVPTTDKTFTTTFLTSGARVIRVRLTDPDGAQSVSAPIPLKVSEPEVISVAGGPYTVDEGGTITLNGSGSYHLDPLKSIVSYRWDLDADGVFGETGTGALRGDETGAFPTFSAAGLDGPGTFSVKLRVADGNGAADVADATVDVIDVAPVIQLGGNSTVTEGAAWTLNLGDVTDPGLDTVIEYAVHWGDGAIETFTSGGGHTHVYADGLNSYTISVDLVDDDGTHGGAGSKEMTVINVPPTIVLSGDGEVDEGADYTLTLGTITDPGADTVTRWTVNWGDGLSDTYDAGGDRTHVYDTDGTYTVKVDLVDEDGTHAGAGSLEVTVNLVRPEVTDLGPIDFLLLEHLSLSNGSLYFRVKTTHKGFLTLQVDVPKPSKSARLRLYDANPIETAGLTPLAASALDEDGNQRIDWPGVADAVYYVEVHGSNADFAVRMANFANHVGTLVTVHGTDSDDTFAFDAAVSRNVTINGVRYHFDDAEVDSVTFDGGQGFDVVEIRDSPGDDTLEAWPDRVVLANTPGEFVVSFTVEVTGFEDMQAYAVGGGSDTAVLHGSASDDKLKSYLSPDDDFVRLRAKDMSYSLRAKLFGRVEGDHGGSGNDMAVFTGSDGDDEFNFDGLTNTAQTQRPGRRHSATGFDRVIAQAGGGDADLAYFTDMPGEGERMDDVFYFKPHKTQLVGQTVNVTARAFDQVHAEDINGGFGVARIYDTAGDEHFEFIGDTARVYRRIGTELDLLYEAVAFERVKAYRSTGNDTKDDTNHAFGDELYLYGWEE